MKTPKLIFSLLLCMGVGLAVLAKKDPTLLKVDGKDIPVSDFNYLYNKNNAQQVDPQTVDSYLNLFIDYRLKVADALNARFDTVAKFNEEFEQYRSELARPYLEDKEVAERLKHDAYAHRQRSIVVSHIMVPEAKGKAFMDSLRSEILAGNTTFADAAKQYSSDRYSSTNGGHMGAVTPGRFPYAFEEAAYNTALGEISEPVNSGFGWHIIRVDSDEPASEVNASHILLLTRGKSQDEITQAKLTADSLYSLLQDGADFATLAKQYSQDPGSGAKGGNLGWFSRGVMVQPFDSIAFALEPGQMSKPFPSPFGYHIILKHDVRSVAPYEEFEQAIKAEIERDYRKNLPLKSTLNKLAKRTGSMINQSTLEAINASLAADSILTPAKIESINASTLPAFNIAGKEVSIAKVMTLMPLREGLTPADAQKLIDMRVNAEYDKALFNLAADNLEKENVEYRNLLNEYRDGLLLFEISNKKVWDRASKDEDGLAEFFRLNRDKYTWEKPKFKSYIIFATNDSVLAQIKNYTDSITEPVSDRDAFTKDLRTRFGKDVKLERVIAAQGENVITDYLGFNAAKPEPQSQRWPVYIAFQGKVIDAPEEVADVRGLVVADYQQMLETEWLKELHEKYPVKVNRKELEKLKK